MSRDNDREPASINKIELLGRLGKDPEIKSVGRGELCTMSIATEERWKDRDSGEWTGLTQWHTVTTFDSEHIATADKFQKGDKIYLVGILTYRSWKGDDGKTNYRTEIQLKKWHELERREKAPGRDGTRGRDDDGGRGRNDRDDRRDDRDRDRGGSRYSRDDDRGRRNDADNRRTLDDDLDDEVPF